MLFKPDVRLHRITDISVEMLRQMNIDTLLIDVDNTLSTYKGTKFVVGVENWINTMRCGNIKLRIVSNAKTNRLKIFADRIGINGTGMAAKPLPFGCLHAMNHTGSVNTKTAIVGDQIFTDMIAGHLSGIKTILVTPILPEKKISFRIRRFFEKKLLKCYGFEEDLYVG